MRTSDNKTHVSWSSFTAVRCLLVEVLVPLQRDLMHGAKCSRFASRSRVRRDADALQQCQLIMSGPWHRPRQGSHAERSNVISRINTYGFVYNEESGQEGLIIKRVIAFPSFGCVLYCHCPLLTDIALGPGESASGDAGLGSLPVVPVLRCRQVKCVQLQYSSSVMAWYSFNWRRLFLRFVTAFSVTLLAIPLGVYFLSTVIFRFIRSPRTAFWATVARGAPPAPLQDPDLGEHSYVTLPKGIKLHYVEKGDKSNPLMLLLHGFPEFWFAWKYQLQEFSKDYWTVAVDLRGYGDSDKPPGTSSYRADVVVDDVKELLEALGRSQATLVGHGWGGVLAFLFLERFPERVERLVSLGAPHPVVFQRALLRNRKQLIRSWYIFLFQVPWLPELLMRSDDLACLTAVLRRGHRKPPTVSDEDIEAYKFTFGKPGALTGPINYYRAAGWGIHRRSRRKEEKTPRPKTSTVNDKEVESEISKVPPVLEEVEEEETQNDNSSPECNELHSADSTTETSPPCLLILGGRDAYVERDTAYRTRKFVPNLSVVLIREANHFVQLDDPVAVNAAIRNFLGN